MSLFSFFKKKQPQTQPKIVSPNLPALNAWGIFYQQRDFNLYNRFAGSLPNGNGDYIYLKSYPEIPQLERRHFGEWLHISKKGIYLQQIDDVTTTSCSLLYIDFEALEVTTLKTGIPTKNWEAGYTNNNNPQIIFKGPENETYSFTA